MILQYPEIMICDMHCWQQQLWSQFSRPNLMDMRVTYKYNFKKPITGVGSCIFIHLTKDYKPTAGCIALNEKDFLIMLKLIKKNSKIKIF